MERTTGENQGEASVIEGAFQNAAIWLNTLLEGWYARQSEELSLQTQLDREEVLGTICKLTQKVIDELQETGNHQLVLIIGREIGAWKLPQDGELASERILLSAGSQLILSETELRRVHDLKEDMPQPSDYHELRQYYFGDGQTSIPAIKLAQTIYEGGKLEPMINGSLPERPLEELF